MLPGPNIVNLALMLGDRFFGLRAPLAALGGMLRVPLVIVLVLTAPYAEFSRSPVVAGALRGMGAVAAGLIIATAIKLMATLRSNRARPAARGRLSPPSPSLAIAWLRWPLVWVVAGPRQRWRCGARLAGDRAMSGCAHLDALRSSGRPARPVRALPRPQSCSPIGGAITTAPDMHRYVVDEHHWISDAQFSASIAIAQAAPGPNVLFVAVIGWNVAGPLGALATMAGTLLPSTALTLLATRWGAAAARDARRARLQDRPDAADHRPARRHRLAARAALRRRSAHSARRDRADRCQHRA